MTSLKDDIVSQIKLSLELDKVSVSDIPNLVIKAMESVERLKKTSGSDKKDLVIGIVVDLVDELDLPFEETLLPLLGAMVESILEADAGKVHINKNLRKKFMKFISVFKCTCK